MAIFYHIFQFIFTSAAWSQYLTLIHNCIHFLKNFETTHRPGSILIVKWENISVKVPGCDSYYMVHSCFDLHYHMAIFD